MLTPGGRAGIAETTPLLKGNDPAAAAANWSALNQCIRNAKRFRGAITIRLPAGWFYVGTDAQSLFALDEAAAGLVIEGMGAAKTILVPGSTVAPVQMLSTRIAYFSVGNPQAGTLNITGVTDLTEAGYQVDDVIYVWRENTGNTRSPSQRLTVFDFTGSTQINVNETIASFAPTVRMKHVKGVALSGVINAGASSVTLTSSGLASRLQVGGDVMIGDGPGLNNFYGEFARVREIDGTTVWLDRRLRREYAPSGSGREACIVPGPHMSDITIRGLSIAAPEEAPADGFGMVRFGLRVRFEDVEFISRPGATEMVFSTLNLVNCGNVSVSSKGGCGLQFAASQDVEIRGSTIPGVTGDEYCSDLLFDGIATYRPEGFAFASASGRGPCERVHLVNSRITNYGTTGTGAKSNVSFVKDSVINNVQLSQPNAAASTTVVVEDDGVSLVNVSADSDVKIDGVNLRVFNLSAPHLELSAKSTGLLVTPMLDPQTVADNASPGAWRTPLNTYINGWVAADDPGTTPLVVHGIASQSAPLTTWQAQASPTPTPLFAVRADGNLATAKTIEAISVSTLLAVLPIYNFSGLVGYIPIYQTPSGPG